jgi:hypothetical protein
MPSDDDDDASAPASRAANEPARAVAAASVPLARRRYRAPTIRRLGCVRDLTLGGASGFAEGAGTFIRPMM